MVLYYRITGGDIAQMTLSCKSITEDVAITSVSRLSYDGDISTTIAAVEMPKQQYAVFFAGRREEKGPL